MFKSFAMKKRDFVWAEISTTAEHGWTRWDRLSKQAIEVYLQLREMEHQSSLSVFNFQCFHGLRTTTHHTRNGLKKLKQISKLNFGFQKVKKKIKITKSTAAKFKEEEFIKMLLVLDLQIISLGQIFALQWR